LQDQTIKSTVKQSFVQWFITEKDHSISVSNLDSIQELFS